MKLVVTNDVNIFLEMIFFFRFGNYLLLLNECFGEWIKEECPRTN